MTLVLALLLQSFVPFQYPNVPTGSTTNNCALNSASVRCAMGYWMHKDTDVQYVLLRIGTVTTGDTIRVSLQYADASGLPSGTPLASASLTVTSGMANTWQEVAFSSPFSVTQTPRQLFVIVDYEVYSGGNLAITNDASSAGFRSITGSYNGSSWSLPGAGSTALLRRSDGSVIGLDFVGWARGTYLYSTSSNPDEAGIACTFDRAMRVVGMEGQVFGSGAASQYRIYQGSTLLWSADGPATDSTVSQYVWVPVVVSPSVLLKPGVEYIFAWRPTTTSNSPILSINPGYPSAYNGWFTAHTGGSCRIATRVDDGAWQYNSGNTLFYVRPILQEVHGGVQ